MFQGFVQQEGTITLTVLATNSSRTPVNLDALPGFRVYGPAGVMPSGSGTASFKDSQAITGATNASPIVVTSAAHGLTTGTQVTLTGVLGNTAANGSWTITVIDANTFSLNGSTGNSAYTSGGVWNTTGLYQIQVACLGAETYSAGTTYSVLVSGLLSSTPWAELDTFCVG